MSFESVETPLSSPEAFGLEGDAATLSSAAILLVLGFRLRGDERALEARASDTSADRREPPVIALPEEDVAPLQVPPLTATGERVTPREAQAWADSASRSRYRGGSPRDVTREVARAFHAQPTHLGAAALFEACLSHPEELPRVAAASSYLDLTTDPSRPLETLRQGLRSEDDLTREVAATSLAHYVPDDPALAQISAGGRPPGGGHPSRTCILVHGTWGQTSAWWQPGGDFYQYFTQQVRNDVYSAADRCSWKSGYSDGARALGALALLGWVSNHNLNGLDVVAHSHGGNVVMLATQGGLDVGKLVLLSCPVHIPKYLPDFTRIVRAVSIRVHLDLVILADRGGQRFSLPEIDEHVLPIWFNHFATHDPQVWMKYQVPQWL